MKETFYFPHDYNAHTDEKILKLRRVLKLEGYGIYWCLIEMLASSTEGRLKMKDIEDIAFVLQVECERIAQVITNFNLFEIDDEYFWSKRLIQSFKKREEKSKKARDSAKIRWSREKEKPANALRTHCNSNAIKERKGKEKKEKESIEKNIIKKENNFLEFSNNEELQKNESIHFSQKLNLPEPFIRSEIQDNFIPYWLDHQGASKKTFEVRRRLQTWFSSSMFLNKINELTKIKRNQPPQREIL